MSSRQQHLLTNQKCSCEIVRFAFSTRPALVQPAMAAEATADTAKPEKAARDVLANIRKREIISSQCAGRERQPQPVDVKCCPELCNI